MTEEDQIFYTDDDEETEEQLWQRKKEARSNPTTQLPDITLDKLSLHKSTQIQTPTLQKLAKPITMAIEQNNDITLQQLRFKLQKEEYSETILQQDPRYRHYCRQLDRLFMQILSAETITMKPAVYNFVRCYYQNILSLNYSNPYMELRINIREFPKCFMRYVKNTIIRALQKLSKNGPRVRNLHQRQTDR